MSTAIPTHPLEAPLPEPVLAAGRRERLAAHVLQAGAVAVVLAVVTNRNYELDRFFVPKELVLHLTALAGGVLALRAIRRLTFTRIDRLLLLYLGLSIVSAAFATNLWLAARAVAMTASGIALFWTARALARAGLARPVLAALALAVVTAAATSLLQTYGLRTDFFSANRAPGGTLGNRNFVAHLAALGFPLVLLGALNAPRLGRYLLAAAGTALTAGVLILTRSRAGWLAFAGGLAVILLAMLFSPLLRTRWSAWLRLAGVAALAGVAIAGAVRIPNSLRWVSDNPYLESMRSVANFQEGSGRGRLVQYRQSLLMTLHHPLLGVGPGNWSVAYPDHAARADGSLSTSSPGTTLNPWPSSDWIAFVSERGPLAALVFTLVFLGIAARALERLFLGRDATAALRSAALLAILLATAVAGTFDAVLLLALPAFMVWAAAGALWPDPEPDAGMSEAAERRKARGTLAAAALVLLISAAGAARSTAQLTAMAIHGSSTRLTWLTTAARIDPANYRLRLQLARPGSGLARAARCAHARAAHALYPSAAAATRLSRGCR